MPSFPDAKRKELNPMRHIRKEVSRSMRKNNDTTDPIAETAEEAETYEKSKDELDNILNFGYGILEKINNANNSLLLYKNAIVSKAKYEPIEIQREPVKKGRPKVKKTLQQLQAELDKTKQDITQNNADKNLADEDALAKVKTRGNTLKQKKKKIESQIKELESKEDYDVEPDAVEQYRELTQKGRELEGSGDPLREVDPFEEGIGFPQLDVSTELGKLYRRVKKVPSYLSKLRVSKMSVDDVTSLEDRSEDLAKFKNTLESYIDNRTEILGTLIEYTPALNKDGLIEKVIERLKEQYQSVSEVLTNALNQLETLSNKKNVKAIMGTKSLTLKGAGNCCECDPIPFVYRMKYDPQYQTKQYLIK